MQKYPAYAVGGLFLWAVFNGLLVARGYAGLPLVSLMLGLLGAGAVIALAALLAKTRIFDALRYCGEHSIVIYLAFFLFMAATRVALLKSGLVADIGVMSAIVTFAGVLGPLTLFWLTRNTGLRFLFERPQRFWLAPKSRLELQPAE